MIKNLMRWWKSLLSREKHYGHCLVDELPEHPEDKTIYLVTHLGHCWQIVMICPCGCRKVLYMNAIKDHHPYWRYEIHGKRRLSLHPSIHRQVGCKSHFFVRGSKIVWCK
jgi:hypothetical protein